MHVDVEDISSVRKTLHIQVPEEDVARELEKAYGTLRTQAKIKGFRQGKVPLSILEQRFKNEVHADVSGQLIQDSYGEALRQTELAPLGEPTIDRPELEKGRPYRYSVTFDVRPFIEDLKLDGFQLQEKAYTVTEEEVAEQLGVFQKQRAQLKKVDEDRPVQKGDIVIIDYEGFRNGEPLDAARKTENFQIEVGSGRILEDFDQKLVGMGLSEKKTFQITFPEDYYSKDLAGLEVDFEVFLKEINEEVLPELDDRFAKEFGEYKTLEELKGAIREELQRRYNLRSERELRDQIVDQLIAQSDFALPEVLVKEEVRALVDDAQNAMAHRGMSLEESGQTEEGLSRRFRPAAEKKVREHLLLQKVIDQQEIRLTDEIIEQGYAELSEAMSQPVETIKQVHGSYEHSYQAFTQRLLEKEAIRCVREKSQVEKVEAGQEASQEEGSDNP